VVEVQEYPGLPSRKRYRTAECILEGCSRIYQSTIGFFWSGKMSFEGSRGNKQSNLRSTKEGKRGTVQGKAPLKGGDKLNENKGKQQGSRARKTRKWRN